MCDPSHNRIIDTGRYSSTNTLCSGIIGTYQIPVSPIVEKILIATSVIPCITRVGIDWLTG